MRCAMVLLRHGRRPYSVLSRLGLSAAQSVVADPSSFSRARLLPLAMANHLALGSVFAWSIFNKPLMCLHGVVAPSAADWSLGDVSLTFSLVMGGFVWGAVLSRKLDEWGPRASCLMGAGCLGGGFGLAALAAHVGSLPLLFAGGAVWGVANGLAYVPPVAMLLKWYPERKGFAAGAALVGFGGGALVAAPLFSTLLAKFRQVPQYLGPTDCAGLANRSGKLFVGDVEAVAATTADLANWPGLVEGLYAVDTGSTGAAATLAVLGAGYATAMALASIGYRLPAVAAAASTSPSSSLSPLPAAAASVGAAGGVTPFAVDPGVAVRTPQFYLLWSAFGMSIMGSYGILAAGQTMLLETFGKSLPLIVTGAFAASFVVAMSTANLVGRVAWSNASDSLAKRSSDPFWGRRIAYSVMWGLGAPMYGAILWSIHANAASPGALPLAVFSGGVCGIIACFGGAAATWPAITADLWGTKNVGVIQARQMSVVLPAAFLGPRLVTMLRENGIERALKDLAERVPDDVFEKAFGAGKASLDVLIASKTVTINRLLELAGPLVADPTPFLYDNMLAIMATLQGLSFVAVRLLGPVHPKHHSKQ